MKTGRGGESKGMFCRGLFWNYVGVVLELFCNYVEVVLELLGVVLCLFKGCS